MPSSKCLTILLFISILLLDSIEARRSTRTTTTEATSEENIDTVTRPAFQRSKFNLRASTTETTTTSFPYRTPKIRQTDLNKTVKTTTTTTTEAPFLEDIQCGVNEDGSYPWIAILEHTNPESKTKNPRKTLSKGVLVNERHVLTTISSIQNSHPFWVVSGVRLGAYPTKSSSQELDKSKVVFAGVEQVFLHSKKDIALVRMNISVEFTESIAPACLPRTDFYGFSELYFHVCQKIKNTAQQEFKSRLVSVTSMSQQDCFILFKRKDALISRDEICAWDEVGDTCTGDIGGPLLAEIEGRFHVVGLNSYVVAKKSIDAEDLPGVYTRVGSHLRWIESVFTVP